MPEGFIKIYRSLFVHLLWEERRSFSKAEAWIDLLQTARYRDGEAQRIINDRVVTWSRGELIASVRFLQKRWQWKSTSKVEHFLNMLESLGMIQVNTEQGIGRITICNYESYNNSEDTDGTPANFDIRKPNKKVPKYSEQSTEYIIAEQFYNIIKDRSEGFREPNLQSWAKHIDLMIRVDQRSPADVTRVMTYAQTDCFWQNVVLSTDKLRSKFDQLKLKMESGTNEQKSNTNRYSKRNPKGNFTKETIAEQLREIYSDTKEYPENRAAAELY